MTKSHPVQLHHFRQHHCPKSYQSRDAAEPNDPVPSRTPLQPNAASIDAHLATYPTNPFSLSTLQIVPATYDDIPDIADIHIEAYRNDVMVRLEYGDTPIADIKKAMIANIQEQWTKWDGEGLWALKAVYQGEAVGCAIWGVKDGRHKKASQDEAEVMSGIWEVHTHLELRQAFGPPQYGHWPELRNTNNQASTTAKYCASAENNLRNAAHVKLMQLHAKWVNNNTRFLCKVLVCAHYSARQC